jgi:hypothetical protein
VKALKELKLISSGWFYSNPHPFLRFLTIYVKGDALIILPFLSAIAFLGFFSLEFMFFVYALFFTLRHFGEMIYWFSHQFWDKKYRPYDYGFVNLSNDAVYILYQLMALVLTVFWTATTIGILIKFIL